MWCRTILTAVAISYVICVLVLSGLQKGDLDSNTWEKLRRHNVNIDDMNNGSLRQGCLLNSTASTGNATPELQTEDIKNESLVLSAANKSDTNRINVGNIGDYLKLEMHHPEIYNVQNVLQNEAEDFIRQVQTFNDNFRRNHETQINYDLGNVKKIIEKNGLQIEYIQNQPSLQNVVNFWTKLTKNTNFTPDTTVLPNIFEEKNVSAKIETTYNNGYVHSREIEYISRILAEYLASQTVPTTTQRVATKIDINLITKKNANNETLLSPELNDKKGILDIITHEVYPNQLNNTHVTEEINTHTKQYDENQHILKSVQDLTIMRTEPYNHELRLGPNIAKPILNENAGPIQFLHNFLQINSTYKNNGQLIPYTENNAKSNKLLVSENNQQHDKKSYTLNETINSPLESFPKEINSWQSSRNLWMFNKQLKLDKKDINQDQSFNINSEKIKNIEMMGNSRQGKSFGTNDELKFTTSNLKKSNRITNLKINNDPYNGIEVDSNISEQMPNFDKDSSKLKRKSADLKKRERPQLSKMHNGQFEDTTTVKKSQHAQQLAMNDQFKDDNKTKDYIKKIKKKNQFESISEDIDYQLEQTQPLHLDNKQPRMTPLDMKISKHYKYIDDDNDQFKAMLPSIKNSRQHRIQRLNNNRLKMEELNKSERNQRIANNFVQINNDMPAKRNQNSRMNNDQFNTMDVETSGSKHNSEATVLKSYDSSQNNQIKVKNIKVKTTKLNKKIVLNSEELRNRYNQNLDSNNYQRQFESEKQRGILINVNNPERNGKINKQQHQAEFERNRDAGYKINRIPVNANNPEQNMGIYNQQRKAGFQRNLDFRIQLNDLPDNVNIPEKYIARNNEELPAWANQNLAIGKHLKHMGVNKYSPKRNQHIKLNNKEPHPLFNRKIFNSIKHDRMSVNRNNQSRITNQDSKNKFKHIPVNIQNSERNQKHPVPRAGLEAVDFNHQNPEISINGLKVMPAKFIEDIAEKVKKMVLTDIKKDETTSIVTILYSSLSTAVPKPTMKPSIVTTTEKPTTLHKETKEEMNVIQKLLEMFNEFKTINNIGKTTTGMPSMITGAFSYQKSQNVKQYPVTKTVDVKKFVNLKPFEVTQHNVKPVDVDQTVNVKPFYVNHLVNVDPVEISPYGLKMVPVHISSGVNLPPHYAAQYIPRLNIKQKNEYRPAAITLQTNAEEIAPLAIQISKPLNFINKQVVLTTKTPSEILKEEKERESKKRLEEMYSNSVTIHKDKLQMNSETPKKQRLADGLKKDDYSDRYTFGGKFNEDRENPIHRHEYSGKVQNIETHPAMTNYPDQLSHTGHHGIISHTGLSHIDHSNHPRGFSHYPEGSSQLDGFIRPGGNYNGLYGYSEQHQRSHPRLSPTKFHEQLERIESWPRNNWRGYKPGSREHCCEEQIPARQQMPLRKVKQRTKYDDTHFKNFLESQQKVTDMLEKILTDNIKNNGPSSVEVP